MIFCYSSPRVLMHCSKPSVGRQQGPPREDSLSREASASATPTQTLLTIQWVKPAAPSCQRQKHTNQESWSLGFPPLSIHTQLLREIEKENEDTKQSNNLRERWQIAESIALWSVCLQRMQRLECFHRLWQDPGAGREVKNHTLDAKHIISCS